MIEPNTHSDASHSEKGFITDRRMFASQGFLRRHQSRRQAEHRVGREMRGRPHHAHI